MKFIYLTNAKRIINLERVTDAQFGDADDPCDEKAHERLYIFFGDPETKVKIRHPEDIKVLMNFMSLGAVKYPGRVDS